jgi:pimeloyl-ACP methyl ester carboxylesterase
MNDFQSMDPAMEKIRINQRELAFYRVGSGSPAVILETGLGAESREWTPIQRSIGAITLAFRYDRVGRGASDPVDSTRSAGEMVKDLHTLLKSAGIPGPYILVGHSFGGLLMRLFAHRYRAEAGGLLLVEALSEDQFNVIGPALPPATPDDAPPLRNFREFWTGGWRDPESTPERIDFSASFRQALEIRSLGELPVHIITAGSAINSPFMPESARPRIQSLWDGLQRRFLKLSPLATQSFVPASGHFVQRDAPEVVVEAIKELIARVRGNPLRVNRAKARL